MVRAPDAAPRLASDVIRATVAGALAALTMFVGAAVLTRAGAVQPGDSDLARLSLYLAWCVLVAAMTIMILLGYGRADGRRLRGWMLQTRPPRNIPLRVLWWMVGGGAISWAISGAAVTMYTLIDLAMRPDVPTPTTLGIGIAVVISSFVMIVISYAVHYARADATRGGFAFPGEEAPRFMDYVYLAGQVSTTFGASDVALTSSSARRAVLSHSLIAMAFNTVLISLLVSALLRGAGA
jgi:hypothetical protein